MFYRWRWARFDILFYAFCRSERELFFFSIAQPIKSFVFVLCLQLQPYGLQLLVADFHIYKYTLQGAQINGMAANERM